MSDDNVFDLPVGVVNYQELWASVPDELKRLVVSANRLVRLVNLDAPSTVIEHERKLLAERAQEATTYCAGVYADHRAFRTPPGGT